jgi:hypothetical protein
MAGASVPLEVVGGIMAFVGGGVPTTLTFRDIIWHTRTKSITAHPDKFKLEIKTPQSAVETWPRSNETTALAKAVVRSWLTSTLPFKLTVTRGIITESVVVSSLEFDGSYETFSGSYNFHDEDTFKSEADRCFMEPDKPLPKHFKRLRKLHQQQRKRQLATAHTIAHIFFSAPTHY